MTRTGFWTLTRHFARCIVAPPLLTDLGVDFLRRTLASVLAILLVAGIFLTRALFKKYVSLHAHWDEVAYLRAVEADTLLMISIPMVVIGLVAIIVSPMLFPDEIDYRTLAHLPIPRLRLFAAKFTAVAMVAAAALLGVTLVTCVWFPVAVGGRWMPHTLSARVGAHAAATLAGSAWMFLAVMALQGFCLSAVPDRWRRRVALLLHGTVFVGLLMSLPSVVRIPTMNVSSDLAASVPLVWAPPVWFLGLNRWLLEPAHDGYATVARIGAVSSIFLVALIVAAYARLYRSCEKLALDRFVPSRVGWWATIFGKVAPPSRLSQPTRAVLAFANLGLGRSRLHQFVFLLVIGAGLAILLGQIVAFFNGGSFLGYRPRQQVHSIIAAPLLVALATTLALRAAFLLPLDQQASWVFKLTDAPDTRPHALDAVSRLLTVGAVAPALLVASALQPGALGARWPACVLLTTLANLVLVEIVLHDWARLPFTCSYLPGKRVLAYTLGVLLGTYFVFVYVGAHVVRWSMADPMRTIVIGVMLLMMFVLLRRSRLRTWGRLPLEFEDEDPLAIRSLNLLPDERH